MEDANENVYIFWLSSTGNGDEICFKKFNHSTLSETYRIESRFSYTVLDFSCEKDDASKIWIAYTQYDGDDWEIYTKCFDEIFTYRETHLKYHPIHFRIGTLSY